MAKRKASGKVPGEAGAVLERIVALTDAFCRDHLNDEYADLARAMAAKLARKRPSPLLAGKPEAWASGIVRAVGWVNFLGDKGQTPHMKMDEIDKALGVGVSTGAARLRAIQEALDLRRLDPAWTLPSRLGDNILVWMLKVNGLVVDIRDYPREAQEVAFEQGLIPYIPADREEGPPE